MQNHSTRGFALAIENRADQTRATFSVTIECSHLEENARDSMSPARLDLAELELAELEALLETSGRRALPRPPDLPLDLPARRHRLRPDDRPVASAARAARRRVHVIDTPRIVSDELSTDGTRKFALELADGRRIESVFIPDTPAMTFCISTQVGCAMACGFCLTGKMGLVRNLTAGEIAGQVRVLAAATGLLDQPFNIVLMGMGEPLHNYEQHDEGAAHAARASTASPSRRAASRCRQSASSRDSSGWRTSR